MPRLPLWAALAALASATTALAQAATMQYGPGNTQSYVMSPNWNMNAPPQNRKYTLIVTNVTGSPDGVVRPVLAINGQMPGPLIEANGQDTLSVTVVNHMNDDLSMHWHGLNQNGTNWEDGVTGVTQCPILPGGSYTYNFALNGQYGTYWYHSHARTTLADGVVGPLVIHSPNDPLKRGVQYDDDQVVFLNDWFHNVSDVIDAALESPAGYDGNAAAPPPQSALINGVGSFPCNLPTAGVGCHATVPSKITVRPGVRTRLRYIGGMAHATLRASVDQHPMNVIEADGTGIQGVPMNRVTVGPGQRYSGVITTTLAEAGKSYWMRAAIVTGCFAYTRSYAPGNATAFAIVQVSSNTTIPAGNPTSTDFTDVSNGGTCVDPDPTTMKPLVVVNPPATVAGRGFFRSQFLQPPNLPVSGFVVNGIQFRAYPWEPLLYNFLPGGSGQLPPGRVANITEALPTWYDMVMVNLDPFPHPFHRHSEDMHIVAQGNGNPTGAQLNALTYNTNNPLYRDTVAMGANTYMVVRVPATSPGVWAWHCHIGFHLADGKLAVVVDNPSAIAQFKVPAAQRALCNAAPPNAANVTEPGRRKRSLAARHIEYIPIERIQQE